MFAYEGRRESQNTRSTPYAYTLYTIDDREHLYSNLYVLYSVYILNV